MRTQDLWLHFVSVYLYCHLRLVLSPRFIYPTLCVLHCLSRLFQDLMYMTANRWAQRYHCCTLFFSPSQAIFFPRFMLADSRQKRCTVVRTSRAMCVYVYIRSVFRFDRYNSCLCNKLKQIQRISQAVVH